MRAELTDDYWHIVYNTYKEDRKLIGDFHFCSPSTTKQCANYTVGEIFGRMGEDAIFFAILENGKDVKKTVVFDETSVDLYDFANGGLIGFAAFDTDMGRLFSYGIKIEHRRNGIFPLFMKELRKLANKEELIITLTENNERDMIAFRKMGIMQIGMDYENSEKILRWD